MLQVPRGGMIAYSTICFTLASLRVVVGKIFNNKHFDRLKV